MTNLSDYGTTKAKGTIVIHRASTGINEYYSAGYSSSKTPDVIEFTQPIDNQYNVNIEASKDFVKGYDVTQKGESKTQKVTIAPPTYSNVMHGANRVQTIEAYKPTSNIVGVQDSRTRQTRIVNPNDYITNAQRQREQQPQSIDQRYNKPIDIDAEARKDGDRRVYFEEYQTDSGKKTAVPSYVIEQEQKPIIETKKEDFYEIKTPMGNVLRLGEKPNSLWGNVKGAYEGLNLDIKNLFNDKNTVILDFNGKKVYGSRIADNKILYSKVEKDSGIVRGLMQSVKERPLDLIASYGAGYGTGRVLGFVSTGASGFGKATLTGLGTIATGVYGYGVTKEVLGSKDRTATLTKEAVSLGFFSSGFKSGSDKSAKYVINYLTKMPKNVPINIELISGRDVKTTPLTRQKVIGSENLEVLKTKLSGYETVSQKVVRGEIITGKKGSFSIQSISGESEKFGFSQVINTKQKIGKNWYNTEQTLFGKKGEFRLFRGKELIFESKFDAPTNVIPKTYYNQKNINYVQKNYLSQGELGSSKIIESKFYGSQKQGDMNIRYYGTGQVKQDVRLSNPTQVTLKGIKGGEYPEISLRGNKIVFAENYGLPRDMYKTQKVVELNKYGGSYYTQESSVTNPLVFSKSKYKTDNIRGILNYEKPSINTKGDWKTFKQSLKEYNSNYRIKTTLEAKQNRIKDLTNPKDIKILESKGFKIETNFPKKINERLFNDYSKQISVLQLKDTKTKLDFDYIQETKIKPENINIKTAQPLSNQFRLKSKFNLGTGVIKSQNYYGGLVFNKKDYKTNTRPDTKTETTNKYKFDLSNKNLMRTDNKLSQNIFNINKLSSDTRNKQNNRLNTNVLTRVDSRLDQKVEQTYLQQTFNINKTKSKLRFTSIKPVIPVKTPKLFYLPSKKDTNQFNNVFKQPKQQKGSKRELGVFALADLGSVNYTELKTGKEAIMPKLTKDIKKRALLTFKGYGSGYIPTEQIRTGKVRW